MKWSRLRLRWLALAGVAVLLCWQTAGATGEAPSTPASQPRPDPLGRGTPSGTVFGFLQTAQAGNLGTAADYLQLSNAVRQSRGKELAGQLKVLMDRAFAGSLYKISTSAEGVPQEGVPKDHQKIGVLDAGDAEVPVVLAKVGDAWLFSSDTLAKVPDIYDQLQAQLFETRLPTPLVSNLFLGMPVWQWLALVLAIPAAAGLAWVVAAVFGIGRHWWHGLRKIQEPPNWKAVSGPAWLLVAAGMHRVAAWYIRLPLLHRHHYYQISDVILLVGFFWLLFRVVGKLMQRFITRAIAAGRTGAGTLGVLGDRVLKLLVLLVAVFSILKALGFDLTTALAGVGIGGIAIAFAAQKTLENLFGGLSVLGDEVIRVGDDCRFGDRVGRVEDISLRSTRVRTLERTMLSIPNGSLATMNVENLSRRDKTLFNVRFSIRSETSSDQLRFLLAQVRRMLYEHPRVEAESARVRFGDIEEGSFVLEIFAYILDPNPAEALAIREDLLLRITTIVEQSGTRFASPSRLIQVARDSGLNKEKTETVVKTVEQWRDEKQLPFPDFSPEEKSSFRGSIAYPGPDSSIGDHRG